MCTNTKQKAINEVITKEIEAKSLLRKFKRMDSWFMGRYSMNLYRGCTHNCAYCDGRAEQYQIESDFGKTVSVKINAPELLEKALSPQRKRKPLEKSVIILGGGVSDSYQPAEKQYELSRKALKTILKYSFSVHILTKSDLVLRDLDLITAINQQSRAIVSFSFSSVNENVSKIFEPGVPSPTRRLEAMAKLKQAEIPVGMFLMPVIPLITDTPQMMDSTINAAKQAGIDFIIFGGMTLKQGRQKTYFLEHLSENYPELLPDYDTIYAANSKWRNASSDYYHTISNTFLNISKKYGIPQRIPAHFLRDVLSENDLVSAILDQMDFLLKSQGRTSPYGYAAYSVSQLTVPVSNYKNDLQRLKGVGKVTERFIKEILDTKGCKYYEKLLLYK